MFPRIESTNSDFIFYRNTSKNAKPAKKSQPAVVEKPKKPESKAPKQSYDLPAVQCKDTLLLDYDYNRQFSKRHVVNNWDKYTELSDDDDENGQLSAADFEQLLSASKAVGEHFTFAAERSWLQNQSDESSMAADLFRLNISNLNNGIGRLPFYIRQGLSQDMFTEDEIKNMNLKAGYTDENQTRRKENVKVGSSAKDEKKTNDSLNKFTGAQTKITDEKLPAQDNLVQTLRDAELIDQLTKFELTPTTAASNTCNPIKPTPNAPSKVKPNKTEDIQDWLDDILNEN